MYNTSTKILGSLPILKSPKTLTLNVLLFFFSLPRMHGHPPIETLQETGRLLPLLDLHLKTSHSSSEREKERSRKRSTAFSPASRPTCAPLSEKSNTSAGMKD